jgi:hypothetical protein
MGNGLLYVLSNEWIKNPQTQEMPYKIGITKKTVDERYYGLGLKMPGKFETLFAYELDDYANAEKIIHRIFDKYRVNGEWFNITPKDIELIKANCETMGGTLVTDEIKEEIQAETAPIEHGIERLDLLFAGILEGYKEKGVSIVLQTKSYIRWITKKMDIYFPPGPEKPGSQKDGRKYHYLFDVRNCFVSLELCPFEQDAKTIEKMNNIAIKQVTPKNVYRRTNSKKLNLDNVREDAEKEIRNAIESLLIFEDEYLAAHDADEK